MPITLDGTNGITTPMYNGSITANAVTPSVNMKNRIINGAMVIDQRNAGASVTADGSAPYTLDRWRAQDVTDGAFTIQQNAGSVTPPAGFRNYLGVTTTTADSSLGANQVARMFQPIEGFNVADLNWGTANAQSVTISFWVRSSLTGSFGGSLLNGADNRAYPFSYTISSANTWEQKSVTISGDTTGTWATNNTTGVYLIFGLGIGSNYSGTAGAWASGELYAPTGSVSVIGTLNATWYVTGVQLEVGSTATSFDYRPYGTELALCQRYYQQYNSTGDNTAFMAPGYCDTSSRAFCTFQFPVYMRSAPSLTVVSATAFALYNVPADTVAASSITLTGGSSTNGIVSAATITVNSSGVFTAGRGTVLKDASTSSAGRLQFSAEL